MEATINKIRGCLLAPQKIVDDNVSLFAEIQTLLYKRESNPNKYSECDRELYDIFHLVCSFYLQRAGGKNGWRRKDTGEVIFSYEVDKRGNHLHEEDRIKENEILWGDNPTLPPDIKAELTEGWITSWRSAKVVNKPICGTLDERELMSKDLHLLWQEYNSLESPIYTMSAEDEKRHKSSLLKLIFNSYQRIGFRFIDRVEYIIWIERANHNIPLSEASITTENVNTTLPKQLKPKCIKTPIQRDKLFEKLRDAGFIAENTAKDCFCWAIGSEVQPKQWKPIRWTLMNNKNVKEPESNRSVLREFLVLLIYDTVYSGEGTSQNLNDDEKKIAQNLFVGSKNETLILKNPNNKKKPKGINKGFTSEYENLKNYIHIAKNAGNNLK